MRITRRHSEADHAPYMGLEAIRGTFIDSTGQEFVFIHPDSWPLSAVASIAEILPAVPKKEIEKLREDDVPAWLWRAAPAKICVAVRENSLYDVIDRIAGGICYQGWRAGYFDAENDARAAFDELRWLIAHRHLCPENGIWKWAGISWAYGIEISDPLSCIADWRTGAVRAANSEDMPVYSGFIIGANGISENSSGLTGLKKTLEQISESGGRWSLNPGLGRRPGALRRFYEEAPAGGLLTISPADESFTGVRDDHLYKNARQAAADAGDKIFRRHIDAIIDSWGDEAPDGSDAISPRLRMALLSATQAGIPDSMLESILEKLARRQTFSADDIMGPVPAGAAATETRRTVVLNSDTKAKTVADYANRATQSGDSLTILIGNPDTETTMFFDAGTIRSMDPEYGFLFSDDIGAPTATINAGAYSSQIGLDSSGMEHAIGLTALALDILIDISPSPNPRIARRIWDFRPINICLGNLAVDESGAELSAVAAAASWRAARELAEERGAFPRYTDHQDAIQSALSAQREQAAMLGTAGPAARAWRNPADEDRAPLRNAIVLSAGAPKLPQAVFNAPVKPGIAPRANDLARNLPDMRAEVYNETIIDGTAGQIAGRRTLRNAPGVNHTSLRRCGFTEEVLRRVERLLQTADDLSQCFAPAVLGRTFCVDALKLDPGELSQDDFDVLAAIGFCDGAIDAASRWALGTGGIAAAPSDAHPVRMDRQAGTQISPADRINAMGRIQRFLTGAIAIPLTLPAATENDQIEGWITDARNAGLRALVLAPAVSKPETITLRDDTGHTAPDRPILVPDAVTGPSAGDRTTSSLPVLPEERSATPVSSSADAATDQRQS